MVIPPLIGNPYNWVDDHPLLYGNNGTLDPSTNMSHIFAFGTGFCLKIFTNSTWPGYAQSPKHPTFLENDETGVPLEVGPMTTV